jgi:predicted PurR-regulated permease PerM
MNQKANYLNTFILLLILATLVVGGMLLVGYLQRLTRPLEQAERRLQEQFAQIVNPTPTILPDPITIVRQMQDLSRLETASYVIEKIITAESGQGAFAFLFGDRLILVARWPQATLLWQRMVR